VKTSEEGAESEKNSSNYKPDINKIRVAKVQHKKPDNSPHICLHK